MDRYEDDPGAAAGPPPARQPMLNAPAVILGLVVLLVAVHFAQGFMTPDQALDFLLSMAFIPARYMSVAAVGEMSIPGGEGARLWSFLSYAFVHASWSHVLVNCFWMLAFGSVAARRLGGRRFLVLSAIAAVAAALASLALNWGTPAVVVGASGAIAGQMAVAVRLIFSQGRTLREAFGRRLDRVVPDPLPVLLRNPAALTFLAIWLGMDLMVSMSGLAEFGGRIAWEAHAAGFAAGFMSFGFVDPDKPSVTHSRS